jgi:hypothetical protein
MCPHEVPKWREIGQNCKGVKQKRQAEPLVTIQLDGFA